MRTKSVIGIGAALLTVSCWWVGVPDVQASAAMQKKAKEAGFEVTSCLYCHNEKLPKKGAATENDRGKFLAAEKTKRKAAEVDVAWLKGYKEPAK
jgi:hypothetical protein